MSIDAFTPAVVAGLVLLVAYWAWLWAFFSHVRPRVMTALGRRLKVEVRESTDVLDAGTYDIEEEGAPLRKTGAVYAADLALLVAVTARAVAPATMSSGKARLEIEAVNVGRQALRQCRAAVDDYTSRNGYLHGGSAWFDLVPGERRTVEVSLDAEKPPAGEHRFRVKVECANERLAVADATVGVR